MLFNSSQFLLFFPLVVCLYFAFHQRFRWPLLLGASYYFYACWRVEYLALLIGTTLVDYTAGVWMDRTESQAARKRILMISLASNLGVLLFFKYFNFFAGTIKSLNLFAAMPEMSLLLPVGVSFYTFQSLSYTIDVYHRKIPAERHLGIFATYVTFFPQLVAGPIERPGTLLPQFRQHHVFDWARIADGLKLMLWGFVKKVVIADRLASYVNPTYNDVAHHSSAAILLATYFFAFQIFCDFSGYTDIARGSARVMGYELMANFRQPYLSQSIREFWSRWHISLSSWFRDYLYVPLGGNRVSKWKWYRNLWITFLVSGLWHGANWTFVIWGALHGTYLVIGIATQELRAKLMQGIGLDRYPTLLAGLRGVVTFHLVLFAWIFFRANNISDLWLILSKLAQLPAQLLTSPPLEAPFESGRDLVFIALLVVLAGAPRLWRWADAKWVQNPLWTSVLVSLQFWLIVTMGVFNNQQFIYFQF